MDMISVGVPAPCADEPDVFKKPEVSEQSQDRPSLNPAASPAKLLYDLNDPNALVVGESITSSADIVVAEIIENPTTRRLVQQDTTQTQEEDANYVLPWLRGSTRSFQRAVWYSSARQGDTRALRALLTHGVMSVNARGDWGRTALYIAAERSHVETVAMLLKAGAEPMVTDRALYGDTPLHVAAYKGHTSVVRLLLEAGADPAVANSNGVTPAFLARQPGGGHKSAKDECIEMLEGWRSAVVGTPVLMRYGAPAAAGSVYYFGHEEEDERETGGGAPSPTSDGDSARI